MRHDSGTLTPPTDDGRNVNESLGRLAGEASHLHVKRPGDAFPAKGDAFPAKQELLYQAPSQSAAEEETSYYGRPVIKEPVWTWMVPAYFYVGGAAGAAGTLGMAAQLAGGRELRGLMRVCRVTMSVGCVASAGLLIFDLGRPSRFLNMLRVFRPTSPMNLGTWVLSAAGGLSTLSALLSGERRGSPGLGSGMGLGDVCGVGAGLVGLPLSGYTAVLVTSSAVPVWKGMRRSLPFLFVASGMTAAASLLDLLPDRAFGPLGPHRARRVVRHFGLLGKLVELAAIVAAEREAGRVPRVIRPLQQGLSGALWKASKRLTLASLVTSLLPGSGRSQTRRRIAAGLLGSAGSLLMRFAIARAGAASARDPQATFAQQRG